MLVLILIFFPDLKILCMFSGNSLSSEAEEFSLEAGLLWPAFWGGGLS